ncbi:MAG: hypothetical protein ACPGDB_05405, partial [Fusobacterium sp.]
SVAIKAGTIEILSSWVGTNISKALVPVILAIIGGIMSSFSSTLGVVTPALFPAIPSIAAATGLNPATLFVSVVIGAQATAISPFSSGGSLILGSEKEENEEKLFGQLLFRGVPIALIAAVIFSIVISIIL